ncbi:TonB-dependent receptor [Parapedobacter koreensis]|uniref:Outer membrane receptor proteins, mostly Fe transport n=1 Tax=Parapedobacter koreensis TaxID=332977 RepID=A0A1H7S4Y7_9SPHI|nr:TonB-dependent receptor [Parapedobacter koreensis]SEL66794.1 Outer membrane receptor proteins, mostly Fe transport [Parapedobacter koreensis]
MSKLKIAGLAIGLFMSVFLGYAQQVGQLTGHIVSTANQGIPGITIQIQHHTLGTLSEEDGSFSLHNIPYGKHILEISGVGYLTQTQQLVIGPQPIANLTIILEAQNNALETVDVVGKTASKQLKESGFHVNAIETRQYANTTADLNQILNRSTGIRIREAGGLGSNFNFSINGLSGKAVKYFIDGVPMELLGSAMSLNNIPVNLAERLEVYKGVVPVDLGADAMGGAINVVTNQQARNFLDISHSYGSFNTNRSALHGQYVHPETGLTVRGSGFFNYSDNNYLMKEIELLDGAILDGDRIVDDSKAQFVQGTARRFHDQYRSAMGQLEVGVSQKKWADVLFGSIGYTTIDQDLQTGFDQRTVYGNVTRESKAYSGSLRYKKDNLFVEGLHTNLFLSYSHDHFITADTLMRQYFWDGTWKSGRATAEMGGIRSLGNIIRPRIYGRVNASYLLNEQHSFNVNYTLDNVKNESYNALITSGDDTPGILRKQIAGLAYQQTLFQQKWVNTFFVKQYLLGMEQEKYRDGAYAMADTSFAKYGYGLASRYRINDALGIKFSVEHAYRLQETEEMFGDGLNVQPNPDLLPESSNNLNLGAYYQRQIQQHQFFVEASGFYRDAKDFIYTVPDQRSNALKNENKSNVRVHGFEAEARYQYGSLLTFNVNATYENAINTTKFSQGGTSVPEATYKNKIPNRPWFYGNADLSIGKDNLLGKDTRLTFNWYSQYVHWFYLTWEKYGNVNGKSNIPTQLVHNAMITYSLQNGRYNLSAECRNLTDELAYDNFRLQKPGRSYAVKLRYFIH